ncbi:MAG: sugar ABC transporter permease [Actinomycetota bacterium]|nr:sugar ABC transporter permease [Actinomycetota bacterium]
MDSAGDDRRSREYETDPKATPSKTRADRTKFLFIGPAVVWILAFTIFPLLYALYTSLYSFRYGQRLGFTGLENFARLFTDSNLLSSLRITLTFVVGTVTVQMVLGVALALLLSREIRGSNVIRGVATLPLFATPVAVGYLAITLYYERNGPLNSLIRALGGENIPWLSDPTWALVAVILVDIWQWTPFVFLITLAGLQSLPSELYDAARVDGASAAQNFRFLTLPLLAPLLWLILLLRMVEAFRVFDIPTSLTLGGPGRATEVYSLYTYRTALRFFDHGYAAAQGILLLVIVMFIVTLIFTRVRGLYEEER